MEGLVGRSSECRGVKDDESPEHPLANSDVVPQTTYQGEIFGLAEVKRFNVKLNYSPLLELMIPPPKRPGNVVVNAPLLDIGRSRVRTLAWSFFSL